VFGGPGQRLKNRQSLRRNPNTSGAALREKIAADVFNRLRAIVYPNFIRNISHMLIISI